MTEVQRNTEEPIDSIEPDPETKTSDTKKDTNATDNTNSEDNQLNAERNIHRKVAEEIVRNITDQVKSENFVHENLFQPSNSDISGKEIDMEKSDLVTQKIADSTNYVTEFIQKENIQIGDNERKIDTIKADTEIPSNLVKPKLNEKDSMIKALNKNAETNNGNINSVTENSNVLSNDTIAHTVVENSVARDRMDKTISNEFIPDLNIDDTDVDNSGTNIDSGNDTMGPEGDDGSPESNKVLWTLNGSDHDNHKDEVNDTVMDKLILPSNDARRRVSFGDENISIKEYDMLADRRKSDGMGYDMGNRHSYRLHHLKRAIGHAMEDSENETEKPRVKHSSGDLHSRLKTRKLLGVGETDDGDVHRSKLSQILGHSDQLYIRLPSGLRIWQILLAIIFSVMSIWALIFPSHYFVSMYELDGQSYTFPIRLYATALVCIAVMYWSTIQASDRDVIRLVLLSSIVFFALQTLVTGAYLLTSFEMMTRRTVIMLVCYTLSALIGYYFFRGVATRGGTIKRTTSNKELAEKEQ